MSFKKFCLPVLFICFLFVFCGSVYAGTGNTYPLSNAYYDGEIFPAINFSKVTCQNTTVIKNAKGVLLYKGKITASIASDLLVEEVSFDTFFSPSQITKETVRFVTEIFSEINLFKVNKDGTETFLSKADLIRRNPIKFAGFALKVPEGARNGVYIVVRGDVKKRINNSYVSLAWSGQYSDYRVFDKNKVALASRHFSFDSGAFNQGHRTSVVRHGILSMSFNNHRIKWPEKNILAGRKVLLCQIDLDAKFESAVFRNLILKNLGTATNQSVTKLYLFDNETLSGKPLASTMFTVGPNPVAAFKNLSVTIDKANRPRYVKLYLAADLRPIDYSKKTIVSSKCGDTLQFSMVLRGHGAMTIVTGVDSGEVYYPVVSRNITQKSTIMGAVISALSTDYAKKSAQALENGISKNIFSFKITVPDSVNKDYKGEPLPIKLSRVSFKKHVSGSVVLSDYKIVKVGGLDGEKAAIVIGDSKESFTLDFLSTYGHKNNTDLTVKPGETAEFEIRATINGAKQGDALTVVIEEAFNSNITYLHNTVSDVSYSVVAFPRIKGIQMVKGKELVSMH